MLEVTGLTLSRKARGPEHVLKADKDESVVVRRPARPVGMVKARLLQSQIPVVQSATNRRTLETVPGCTCDVMGVMSNLHPKALSNELNQGIEQDT